MIRVPYILYGKGSQRLPNFCTLRICLVWVVITNNKRIYWKKSKNWNVFFIIPKSFIQGYGLMTCEELDYDYATGNLRNNTAYKYKVPTVQMVPSRFRVKLLEGISTYPDIVYRSKVNFCFSIWRKHFYFRVLVSPLFFWAVLLTGRSARLFGQAPKFRRLLFLTLP